MLQAGNANDHDSGFTLIEVLAVLTIVALTMGIAAVNFARFDERGLANQMATATAIEARAVRSEAIRTGRDQSLQIDLARRRISGAASSAGLDVSEAIDMAVEVSGDEQQQGAGIAAIRFFANGQSTGGTIRFGSRGKAYEVRVNWFTGRVGVAPAG